MQGVLKIDFYVFIVTETWPAYSISISIPNRAIGFPGYDVRNFMALSKSFVSLRKDNDKKSLLC